MNPRTERRFVPGPAGDIECAIDAPAGTPLGSAVICHPHPVHGGTLDNKVVQTLARACVALGWRSVRFNFRGVGGSMGQWDEGVGEIDDALAVIAALRDPALPWLLAGFSFGGFVAASAAQRLAGPTGTPGTPGTTGPARLVLVGPSTQKQQLPAVAPDTIVIHGELDEVVPLAATLDWARPQSLPVIVFPGVGHFFHGQLALLKSVVMQHLQAPAIPQSTNP